MFEFLTSLRQRQPQERHPTHKRVTALARSAAHALNGIEESQRYGLIRGMAYKIRSEAGEETVDRLHQLAHTPSLIKSQKEFF